MTRCDFCDARLPTREPENLALLQHLDANPGCSQQYQFMLQNLRASWTGAMSGG
ncbi:MAG: hypothetical protein ACYDCK_15430 [Thermoplasmatota archaeon]